MAAPSAAASPARSPEQDQRLTDLEANLQRQTKSVLKEREKLQQDHHFLQQFARASQGHAQEQQARALEAQQAVGRQAAAAQSLQSELQRAGAELLAQRERVYESRLAEWRRAVALVQFRRRFGNKLGALQSELRAEELALQETTSRNAQLAQEVVVAEEEAVAEARVSQASAMRVKQAIEARDVMRTEAAARDQLAEAAVAKALEALQVDVNKERAILQVYERVRERRLEEVESAVDHAEGAATALKLLSAPLPLPGPAPVGLRGAALRRPPGVLRGASASSCLA